MGSNVPQSQGVRVAYQLAQHAAAPGQRSDLVSRLIVDARVEEALQPGLVLVHDPERGVLRAGQVAGGIEDPT